MFSFVIAYRYLEARRNRITTLLSQLKEITDDVVVCDQSDPAGPDDLSMASLMIRDPQPYFCKGRALNLAIEAASYAYIAMIDMDIVLPVDFIQQIQKHFECSDRVLLLFDFLQDGNPYFPDSPGGVNVFSRRC